MQIGAQYYRPPFPGKQYWRQDFQEMRDAGFNTVQLWILWSWVESKPGVFDYNDYDQLIELASANNLSLVLSIIPELQPLWIFREIPDSEMINHLNQTVISGNRTECHFGITPGGCSDHPEVWQRMKLFMECTVKRYRNQPGLFGWDIWNELRWNVGAQGLVCYCQHTLDSFRNWLTELFGDLDGLNSAWNRRYDNWQDVDPGRWKMKPFTEMMAFQEFLTIRANRHGAARAKVVRDLDNCHPVTVHGSDPTLYSSGGEIEEQILTAHDRGNDWQFAKDLDGVGCSSFPAWGKWSLTDYAARMETIRSSAGDKRLWLSELQGGQAIFGFESPNPVEAWRQQHWINYGLSAGAEAILFWCWRDEVFTVEAGGFGFAGNDGFAEQRIAAMKKTALILENNKTLFAEYKPQKAEIGLWFSPANSRLHWCIDGNSIKSRDAILGWAAALLDLNHTFEVVEENNLEILNHLKVLILPRLLVLTDKTALILHKWVSQGGTLICESECGSFNQFGFYRYPEERLPFLLTKAIESGRRSAADKLKYELTSGVQGELEPAEWHTTWKIPNGNIMGGTTDNASLAECVLENGKIILVGSFPGEQYKRNPTADFRKLLGSWLEQTEILPSVKVCNKDIPPSAVLCRYGVSGINGLLYIFTEGEYKAITLEIPKNFFSSGILKDLVSGNEYPYKTGETLVLAVPGERRLLLTGTRI